MAADIFRSGDVKRVLRNRPIFLMGDSNVRCVYKDLVNLILENKITSVKHFRGGHSFPFKGDRLLDITPTVTGRDYRETREYKDGNIAVRYMFVTRVYSERIEEYLRDIRDKREDPPKVVVMNSCLWDLTRWGPMKEDQYKEDMVKLFKDLKRSLPSDTLVIWFTTLPVATEKVKGGVFIKQVEFVKHSMRYWILEANKFAHLMCMKFQYDLLDLHYHMRYELHRRATDGLHWEPVSLRYMINIVLTHITLSFNEKLPGNFRSESLNISKQNCDEAQEPDEIPLDKEILGLIRKESFDKSTDRSSRAVKVAKRRNPQSNGGKACPLPQNPDRRNNGRHLHRREEEDYMREEEDLREGLERSFNNQRRSRHSRTKSMQLQLEERSRTRSTPLEQYSRTKNISSQLELEQQYQHMQPNTSSWLDNHVYNNPQQPDNYVYNNQQQPNDCGYNNPQQTFQMSHPGSFNDLVQNRNFYTPRDRVWETYWASCKKW